ncbi:MAG: hypothetical protein SGJ18_09865 [Pseudomonadota bacterium]|nr:hypothetical protein [Pseudomonadota bacterium]
MDIAFAKRKKPIPFDFVLELLENLNPRVRPMFGCHAVYVGDKITVIMRDKLDYTDDNGVWLATSAEHHESLKKIFPNMRSLKLFGTGPTNWQNLPADSVDFEESVTTACELIAKGDLRIGKIPKAKKKSKLKPKKKKDH